MTLRSRFPVPAQAPKAVAAHALTVVATVATLAGAAVAAPAPTLTLKPCRLKGVEHEARCGVLPRALDPARPDGPTINLHVAVLPAVARNKKADPLVFFAGGPGQSAIALAGPVERMVQRFLNRRDIVLIDQRGTGLSAPLACEEGDPTRPLAEQLDLGRQQRDLQACREALQKLPHGDLRFYTTTIAAADVEAVRQALGVGRVNLMGVSYGTRIALEYLRQFPNSVRRVVLDGVAPPDMVLPASMSADGQRAFSALLASCESPALPASPASAASAPAASASAPAPASAATGRLTGACALRYPALAAKWQAVLAGLPREVTLTHPVTGREERVTLTRDFVSTIVRLPLYAPALASGLPYAISEAAAGRFTPLVGLSLAMGGGRRDTRMFMGMHYAVVCSEDAPRMAAATDKAGPDLGDAAWRLYRDTCAQWPKGTVPAAFYNVPPAPVPTLLLSGSDDPATPPRHGDRVLRALGANARHVVVPHAGHGTLALGCLRDVVYRFVDHDDGDTALGAVVDDARCVAAMPRPPAFTLPAPPPAPAVATPPAPPPPAPPRRGPDDAPSSKADR